MDILRAELLKQIKALLEGGEAHSKLDAVIKAVPKAQRGTVVPGIPYSPWQLLEHMRITQRDILDFSSNADGHYQALEWPAQYWPKEAAPPDEQAWNRTVQQILEDRRSFETLLAGGDLTERFHWGNGQTLLREALLIADHAAYHTGEMVLLLRLMGAWKPRA